MAESLEVSEWKLVTPDMRTVWDLYTIEEPLRDKHKELESEIKFIHQLIRNAIACIHRKNDKAFIKSFRKIVK